MGKEHDNGKETAGHSPDGTIYWHPAFTSAMMLDLRKYQVHMYYDTEHELNKKAIIVDLLIIKKDGIQINDNDIGSLMKGHNLYEYKGVGGSLDKTVLSKGLAYAYLYQSHGTSTDRRDYGDMTLTFVREAKPVKLLKQLGAEEYKKGALRLKKSPPGCII